MERGVGCGMWDVECRIFAVLIGVFSPRLFPGVYETSISRKMLLTLSSTLCPSGPSGEGTSSCPRGGGHITSNLPSKRGKTHPFESRGGIHINSNQEGAYIAIRIDTNGARTIASRNLRLEVNNAEEKEGTKWQP